MRALSAQGGQTLVEILASAAVLGILTLAVAATAVGAVREERRAQQRSEALFQLQRGAGRLAEALRFGDGLAPSVVDPASADNACPQGVTEESKAAGGSDWYNHVAYTGNGTTHYLCSDHQRRVLYAQQRGEGTYRILARGVQVWFARQVDGELALLKLQLVGADDLGQDRVLETALALRG